MSEAASEISLAWHLAARLHPAALLIAVLISVGFPMTFYALERDALSTTAEGYARDLATQFEQMALETSELWKYQAQKYAQILQTFVGERDLVSIRVEDETGRDLSGYEFRGPASRMWWNRHAPVGSASIRFNNRVLGTVHVAASQTRTLGQTVMVFLLSSGIGIGLSAFVYVFPVAVARRMEKRILELMTTKEHLYAESQARLARMRRLTEISHVLSSSLDLRRVLDFVTEAASDLLSADLVQVWVIDDDARTLRLAGTDGCGADGTREGASVVFPRGAGLVGWVAEHKVKRYSADLGNDPLQVDKEWVRIHGLVSQLAVPLVVGDRSLGVLVVLTKSRREFSDEEQQLLEIFAGKAATALENVRLYQEARRLLADLASKNAELASFVYSVSHDLKAPLVAIEGMAGALLEDYGPQLDDQARHYVGRLQANVDQMERLIRDLLAISRIGWESRAAEPVELAELVDDIVLELAEPIRARGAKVVVENSATLAGVRTQLAQVMTNLIGNAIKYAGDAASPLVEVGAADRGRFVECWVRDNGIGIDPAYHEKVFEIFQRLNDVQVEGTGVGLAIVKKIVDGVGGRVWVESSRGEGATFRFTWPARPWEERA